MHTKLANPVGTISSVRHNGTIRVRTPPARGPEACGEDDRGRVRATVTVSRVSDMILWQKGHSERLLSQSVS